MNLTLEQNGTKYSSEKQFMVIIGQYILETNKGYIFPKETRESEEEVFQFKLEFLRRLFNYTEKTEAEFYKSLSKIYCKCINSKPFEIEAVTKTPSLNIMNHLDLYSCHKNEFEGLFTRSFRPRKRGILWNIFYFTIEGNNIPTCCDRKYKTYETENIRKIFMNEIQFNLKGLNSESNEDVMETLFYYFFKDVFKGCKIVNFGNILLKKIAECFVLIESPSKTGATKSPQIEMCPALQIEYKNNKENYEIENVDANSEIIIILNIILMRNENSKKYSFLRNLDFSSKIPINLIKK